MAKKEEIDFLLVSFLKGDRVSFEKIYKTYYPLLFSYGCQFGFDESFVDDSIQDVFIEIWQSRDRLNIKALKPYLFKCLRNKITKGLSKDIKEKIKAEKYWHEEFEIGYDPGALDLDAQNKSELENKLIAQIELLSPKQKEIIYLIYYNELSYSEAAEVLGIKIKTAYNQIHSAINFLRSTIEFVVLSSFIFEILY